MPDAAQAVREMEPIAADVEFDLDDLHTAREAGTQVAGEGPVGQCRAARVVGEVPASLER